MKKLTFTIFILLSVLSLTKSQTITEKKNELNLGFFNIFELTSSPELGIGYKRQFNKFAFRFSTTYLYENSEYLADKYGYYRWSAHGYEVTTKLGLEKFKNYTKTQIYYGLELQTSYEQNNYEENISSDYDIWKEERKTYGISPSIFLGVKFFIIDNISISTELNTSCSFTKTIIKIYSDHTNSDRVENAYDNEIKISLQPIGLISLNFHF